MAPDATEGKELRPPSPDRRRNAAGSQEHAAASRVISSALPTHRTAAPRVTALRVRYGGIAVSRWEPTGSGLHAPRGRYRAVRLDDPASKMFVRHACARFRRETGQDDHPHHAPRLARGAVSKGPAPSAHTSGIGGEEPNQHIGLNPPGCRQDRIHHPGNARRSSGVMWASTWRRMSGSIWRSMAHQSSTLYVVAMLPLARS